MPPPVSAARIRPGGRIGRVVAAVDFRSTPPPPLLLLLLPRARTTTPPDKVRKWFSFCSHPCYFWFCIGHKYRYSRVSVNIYTLHIFAFSISCVISSPAQTAWPQYYTCINKQYPLADRESHPKSVSVFAHHPYIYVLVSFLGDIDIYIRVLNIHFFRRPRVPDFASRPFFFVVRQQHHAYTRITL